MRAHQPSGTFNLFNSALSIERRPQSDRITAAWDAYLDCHQASWQGGNPLENITGAIRLSGRDDDQSSYTTGEMAIDSLTCRTCSSRMFAGQFGSTDPYVFLAGERQPSLVNQRDRSRPTHTAATWPSTPACTTGTHAIKLRPRLVVPTCNGSSTNDSADLLNSAERCRVACRLEGTGHSIHALNGAGELHIVDANIYELPVLVAMLKVLRNRTPDTTAFNQCDMKFAIQGDDVHFHQLNLVGDAVSLYGRGETNFDRNLNLTFYSLMGPADLPIPLWRTLIGQASEQILQLKVDGTMDQPQIHQDALPAVNQVLSQIQNQFQAGAATVVPAEAFRSSGAMPNR